MTVAQYPCFRFQGLFCTYICFYSFDRCFFTLLQYSETVPCIYSSTYTYAYTLVFNESSVDQSICIVTLRENYYDEDTR